MTCRSGLSGCDVIAQRSSIRCCACERLICSMRMAYLQLTYRVGATRLTMVRTKRDVPKLPIDYHNFTNS
jgi:hypothetical protein